MHDRFDEYPDPPHRQLEDDDDEQDPGRCEHGVLFDDYCPDCDELEDDDEELGDDEADEQ